MSLLSVKARVVFQPIEKVEAKILALDYEDKESDHCLVWRKKCIRSEEVIEITQFDRDMCIIELYDGRDVLVRESYAQLRSKWMEARKAELSREMGEEEVEEDTEEVDDDENED